MTLTVTAAQYKIEKLSNWHEYENKIHRLVKQAKQQHTNILLFAEYAGLELASWTSGNLQTQCDALQVFLPAYKLLFQTLCNDYQMVIQPGTIPVLETDGFYRNRAFIFSPNKEPSYQDKIYLTPAEHTEHFIKSGNTLTVFDTAFGKIGIAICYDSEFPHLVHTLTKQGATIILVPSCTETPWGHTRVSISCRARAIENQCYVVQSPLIGDAHWCDYIENNVGQAGIFSPADLGFPEDGIVSQGEMNKVILLSSALQLDKLEYARKHGQVTNFTDMHLDKGALHVSHT